MKKVLPSVAFVVLSLLFSSSNVFAESPGCTETDLGCLSKDPAGFVQQIYGWGVSFVGLVAFLFFLFGGYTVLTSRGDPQALNRGKSYMFYALAGLLLAVFGFVFIEVITGALKIPGFG